MILALLIGVILRLTNAIPLSTSEHDNLMNVYMTIACPTDICLRFAQNEECPPNNASSVFRLTCSDGVVVGLFCNYPLTGSVPPFIGSLSNLTSLEISSLSGSVTPAFGQLKLLTTLALTNGTITSLPGTFSQLSNLKKLDLSNNRLSGVAAASMFGSSMLSLNLAGNLYSSIASTISTGSRLLDLNLSNNRFQTIPTIIGVLARLTALDMRNNVDIAAIPTEIANLKLSTLSLAGCRLLPASLTVLAQSTSIRSLDISLNQLAGSLPTEFGRMTTLNELLIDNNQFDRLPPQIGQLTALTRLSASNNRFTGSIPRELGSLNLETLALQNNGFAGVIPALMVSMSCTLQVAGDSNCLNCDRALALCQCVQCPLYSPVSTTATTPNPTTATTPSTGVSSAPPAPTTTTTITTTTPVVSTLSTTTGVGSTPTTTTTTTSSESAPTLPMSGSTTTTTSVVVSTTSTSTTSTTSSSMIVSAPSGPTTSLGALAPSDDNTALIGGVVGGVGVLMIIIAIVAVLVCRGRRTNRDSSTELAPPRASGEIYQNLQLQQERVPHYAPAAGANKAAAGDASIGVYASSALSTSTAYQAPPVVAAEEGSKAVYTAPPRVDTYEELQLSPAAANSE